MLQKKYLLSLVVLTIMIGCGNNESNEIDNKLTFSEKFDNLPTNIDELSSSYDESYDNNVDYNTKNSIEYKGNDEYTNKYIDEITQKLKDYKKELLKKQENKTYKTSSLDNELKIYFLSLKEEFNFNSKEDEKFRKTSTSLDGYVSGYLNQAEYNLYLSDPVKALLCMANGRLAIYYAESNYQDYVLYNGNGDAFRHSLWNYGMSQDVGTTFAKTWADAHENGVANNPWHEKVMDLYNNREGRNLSSTYSFTIGGMVDRTKEAVGSGQMITTDLQYHYYSNTYGEK